MRDIIYIVTSGDYSDYSIDGVFDSRELAEIASNECQYETRIEEYYLNKICDDNPVYWCVEYENDHWTIGQASFVQEPHELNIAHVTKHTYAGESYTRYVIYIKTDGRDAALKIANEKIMQAIARGK